MLGFAGAFFRRVRGLRRSLIRVCVLRSGAEKYKRVQVNPRENEPRELW